VGVIFPSSLSIYIFEDCAIENYDGKGTFFLPHFLFYLCNKSLTFLKKRADEHKGSGSFDVANSPFS